MPVAFGSLQVLITNPHVVAKHFVMRADQFVDTVLTPVLNLGDVARRFEMQGRGITHEHGLGRCRHGPQIADLFLACTAVQKLRRDHDDNAAGETTTMDFNEDPTDAELAAVSRVVQWVDDNLGLTAMFPGDPAAMHEGRADDAPLRRSFSDLTNDELDPNNEQCRRDQRSLVVRCMLHKCSIGDCKKAKRRDCICRGEVEIQCFACRPLCKKGFDENDPCPIVSEGQHRALPEDSPYRLGRGGNRTPCGCSSYIFYNATGKRCEFSCPRDTKMLHVRVPVLMQCWRANMDLRFCLDIQAVKSYIMKYAMKAEKMSRPFKSVMNDLLAKCDKELAQGLHTADRELHLLFTRFLNELTCERDISAVELMHISLGMPLVKMSRGCVWLNLGDDLVPLSKKGDGDAECNDPSAGAETTYSNYLNRASKLESLRLFDLASRFDDKYNAIKDHEKWRYPHVIPFRSPRVTNNTEPAVRDLYARDRLRLFLPHRDDGDLVTIGGEFFGDGNFNAALDAFVLQPECPEVLRREVEHAVAHANAEADVPIDSDDDDDHSNDAAHREKLRKMRAQWSEAGLTMPFENADDLPGTTSALRHNVDTDPARKADEWRHIAREFYEYRLEMFQCPQDGEVGAPHDDASCLDPSWLRSLADGDDENNFTRRPVTLDHLNAGQRFLVNVLIDFDVRQRADPNADPCRMMVPGKAGVGKSFALDSFVHYLSTTHNETVGEHILIVAYTGTAALIVGGTTCHRLFNLPTDGKFDDLKNSDQVSRLKEAIGKARWLFIDERSMIGLHLFGMMEKRTAQARGPTSRRPFRDLNIVMFGDNGQLPPVTDVPLFAKDVADNDILRNGRRAYLSFDLVIPLSQQMRAADDPAHAAMMDRLHDAETTKEDWVNFKKRSLHAQNANTPASDKKAFMEAALWLYANNADPIIHNDAQLARLGTPIAYFKAISTGSDPAIRDHAHKGGGMMRDVYLAKGARVMLRRNLWIAKGLVNGALGRVAGIIFDPDISDEEKPGQGVLPLGVVVVFDKYSGPPYLRHTPRSVFIPVVDAVWTEGDHKYTRTQIPLILDSGLGVHHS